MTDATAAAMPDGDDFLIIQDVPRPLSPKVLGGLAGPIEHSFREYAGLSYQAASIEASKLIAAANASGDWTIYLPERLIALREVMRRHMVSIVKDAS
ncbi:hypothetical protein ABCW43_02345 [Neorhizobium sp. IRAMC:178]|uniref:hypothetical protein n=1 Tax=Neorhizobium tunisiense TaxID=3144793 RepID=UPI0031F646B1